MIAALTSGFMPYLIGAGGLFAMIFGGWFLAKKSGADAVVANQAKAELAKSEADHAATQQVDADLARVPDAALDQRLRDKYARNP